MFNLEQSIAEWRQRMLAAGIKSPVPLEELESHLREEIERQTKAGMDEQQAFQTTIPQIGQAKELKTEFARGRRLMNILEIELVNKKWEAKWVPPVLVLMSNFLFLSFGARLLFKTGGFSQMTSAQEMSALAAVIVSYLLFSSGFWGHKFLPVIPNKRARLAVGAFAAALVSFWVMIFLAHANYSIAEFVVAFCWAFFTPMAALGGLIFGLEKAAQKRAAMADS
jgi:hypothetical protein